FRDITGGSTNGTVTTPSLVVESDGPYTRTTTGASIGSVASVTFASFSFVQLGWGIDFECIMRAPDDITDVRVWIGLFGQHPGDSDDAGRRGVGFRFSTGAGDVGWTPCGRTGSTHTTG